ncbi:MAG: response regulator transcription factor [Stenotrophobium sp.]
MAVKSSTDTVAPVDRYIAKLYRSAFAVTPDEYRGWALREISQVIPNDGGIWGSGSASRMKFHTCTINGVPDSYPATLEATGDINPILPQMLQNLDVPVDMRDVFPDNEFFKSKLYKKAFAPNGISRILSAVHLDPRSGLYSLISLYRSDRNNPFSDQDRALQQRITYHLYSAASHNFFLRLAQDRERPVECAAAVVDQEGSFHQVQPRFLDLLEKHFPDRDPYTLPFILPEPGTPMVIDDLCIQTQRASDTFIVYLWPAGPLDHLTPREREIVHAVAQGLSFKQAARRIGVAPSTVANHLYRVYRKLGVYSRTELAVLVYPKSP